VDIPTTPIAMRARSLPNAVSRCCSPGKAVGRKRKSAGSQSARR